MLKSACRTQISKFSSWKVLGMGYLPRVMMKRLSQNRLRQPPRTQEKKGGRICQMRQTTVSQREVRQRRNRRRKTRRRTTRQRRFRKNMYCQSSPPLKAGLTKAGPATKAGRAKGESAKEGPSKRRSAKGGQGKGTAPKEGKEGRFAKG